ncbi:TPA: SAM-dependent methyltransferase [Enterobacter cloacae]|uniref:SAM-dependent methyltransferase n=1 Tax=Enterobacter cloacae TaxID=550 RepID=UPI003906223B
MNADFLDSHSRHYDDANHLFSMSRLANADQLYGFSVECGLKSLMIAFGMPFDQTHQRPQNRQDRVHADEVWDRYESYRSGHISGANYILNNANPFNNWKASQRYENQSSYNVGTVNPHKAAAEQVRQLVKKAQLEGLL